MSTHDRATKPSDDAEKELSGIPKDLPPAALDPAALAAVTPIEKPSGSLLDRFRSKRPPAAGGVETLIESLPHYPIAHAKDFVRLHPDEKTYWSGELCFVDVPILGTKKDTKHLIDEDLALKHLPSGSIQRFRLALATKPYDVFFLAHIPTTNTDNPWNMSNLLGCEQAKELWVRLTSRKAEGAEQYKIDFAKHADAYPEPKWPPQSLEALIIAAFGPNRMIIEESHPGLLRLIGARQPLA
jgi:hypothetical protein